MSDRRMDDFQGSSITNGDIALAHAAKQRALKPGESSRYDTAHAQRVARLAVQLLEGLRPLHKLDRRARSWLIWAALLHDIAKGAERQHEKAALRIALTAPSLPFDLVTRRIVGLTARYHRKTLPSVAHEHFGALAAGEREIVRQLTAILRLADALDTGHRGLVGQVRCRVLPGYIISRCVLARDAGPEERRLLKRRCLEKGLFLQQVFGSKLLIKWSAS